MVDRLIQPPTFTTQELVEIKAITWNKDSHGLFDYESKSCFHHRFRVRPSDIAIFRNLNSKHVAYSAPEVLLADTQQLVEKYSSENTSLISKLKLRNSPGVNTRVELLANTPQKQAKDQDKILTEESASASSEDIHLIVRSLKNPDGTNRGHTLEIGQQIRLGRVCYTVIEMKTHGNVEYSQTNINSFLKNSTKFEDARQAEPGSSCKICMDETDTHENFLVAPCRCIGSCQYVHLACLRQWLESKVKKQVVGGTLCYNFEKFECEICKAELPKFVVKNGIHQLLKIDRPKETYMILEEAGKARRDMIVIQNVPSDGIKIGRGHQCDIRVTDISVSRVHAFIKLINGKFVLFDNESKFGTLVKLQRDIQINFEKKAFQIGRTVLTFKMKKPKLQREQSNEPMDIELENILKHI